MSDLFVQATSAYGTGSASPTLTGVTAGNTIVAFLVSGGGAPSSPGVSDSQGAYTARGPAALDSGNNVWFQAYVLENANAGSHAATAVGLAGNGTGCHLVEVGSSGASFSGANSNFQSAVGGATDAITTGSMTVTGAATIVAMATDSGNVNVTLEPTPGTGFTGRDAGTNGDIGSWRVETGAFSSAHAATFSPPSPTSPYVSAGVAILNVGSGGGGDSLMGMQCL